MNRLLEFKWSVSRGRDTYGYNICSLYVGGRKVSSCNGGGYDMKGTALGHWIEKEFADQLVKLTIPWTTRNGERVQEYYGLTFHNPNYAPGEKIIDGQTVNEREKEGKSMGLEYYQSFYSASSRIPTEKHIIPLIDGACGFSSVEHIVNALGYTIEYIKSQIYKLTDKE